MVSTMFPPKVGGVSKHVYHLTEAMIARGHKVGVVNPLLGTNTQQIEVESVDGIPVARVHCADKSQWRSRVTGLIPRTLRGLWSIRQKLGGVDVIHQHDYRVSSPACTIASLFSDWYWTNHTSSFLIDYGQGQCDWRLRWQYARCRAVIAVSTEITEKTHAIWPDIPVEMIPNGVDTEMFRPQTSTARARSRIGVEEGAFVVLCPRRMVEKNGVIYFAEATGQIVRRRPDADWAFVFLGSDPAEFTDREYIRRVKGQLREAGALSYTHFAGNLPMELMPETYSMSNVVTFPSLMEGVSLAALEAMACQAPIVASNVGGLKELVDHKETGLLVEPGSPEGLADAVVRLFDDIDLRNRLARAGQEEVCKHYSWDQIAERTEAVYARHC